MTTPHHHRIGDLVSVPHPFGILGHRVPGFVESFDGAGSADVRFSGLRGISNGRMQLTGAAYPLAEILPLDAGKLTPACPTCEAQPGHVCTTPSGYGTRTHRTRLAAGVR